MYVYVECYGSGTHFCPMGIWESGVFWYFQAFINLKNDKSITNIFPEHKKNYH